MNNTLSHIGALVLSCGVAACGTTSTTSGDTAADSTTGADAGDATTGDATGDAGDTTTGAATGDEGGTTDGAQTDGTGSGDGGTSGGGATDDADGGDTAAGYPEGPYGVKPGDVVENIELLEPSGETTNLGIYHDEPGARVLLIHVTTGWVPPNFRPQEALETLATKHADDGLRVAHFIIENAQANDASAEDLTAIAAGWNAADPLFGVAADTMWAFVDGGGKAVPLLLLLSLDDMVLRNVFPHEVGGDCDKGPDCIKPVVLEALITLLAE